MSGDPVALATLMRRVADELGGLEASALSMEGAVAALVFGGGDASACRAAGATGARAIPMAIQDLDRHVQRLRDLSAFVSRLAEVLPDIRIDPDLPLAALRLGQCRDALSGQTAPRIGGSGGEDFFDEADRLPPGQGQA